MTKSCDLSRDIPLRVFFWGRESTPGFRILDINWRCCFFRMRKVLIGIYEFAL